MYNVISCVLGICQVIICKRFLGTQALQTDTEKQLVTLGDLEQGPFGFLTYFWFLREEEGRILFSQKWLEFINFQHKLCWPKGHCFPEICIKIDQPYILIRPVPSSS